MKSSAARKEMPGENRPRRTHEERERQIVEAARRIITDRWMEYLTIHALAEQIGVFPRPL